MSMNHTERSGEKLSTVTGCLAALRVSLRGRETGASLRGRGGAVLGVVCACAAFLTCSAPALAAALETPQLSVESITASSATLHGVLSPSKAGEAGTYEFLYKEGKAGCTGGTAVPTPAGLMIGLEHEEVYEGISGLTADTEYTACVRVVGSGEAISPAVTFTTAIPPETPTVQSPLKTIAATSATLEGVVNPHAAGNPGSYEFLYRASATECEGEGAQASGGSALGDEEETVKAEVTLLPNTTYTFCLRAYNQAGEASALSTSATFATPIAAPAVENESSTNLNTTEARLQATINPGNSETAYHFEYGTSAGSYGTSTPVREIPAGTTGVSVDTVVTGLEPSKTYHFRVTASNGLPGAINGPDETFTTPAAQGAGSPPNCPNEQRRAEQPYALALPDCRAYEMVSPVNTEGQDAVDSFQTPWDRASVSGEALTYAAFGNFADPLGSSFQDQFLSRRGAEGWTTQAITPLHHPTGAEPFSSYESMTFAPDLKAGLVTTNSPLTGEAPAPGAYGLYVSDFADSSYRFAGGENFNAVGASVDLSHVVFVDGLEESGLLSEWVNGEVVPVGVTNDSEDVPASGGGARNERQHAVSANGSRVYFSHRLKVEDGYIEGPQLYVRENAEQPKQSPLASAEEANGEGTLTAGSNKVTSLVTAIGELAPEPQGSGSTELRVEPDRLGQFRVGQKMVSGGAFAPVTEITKISGDVITLSQPTIENLYGGNVISAEGPEPFTVGQKISGNGIPRGTTITAVASGGLTLSAPAASSGSEVALSAGGECTVPADACTVEVSASQRLLANPAGLRETHYVDASTDGSRVFFTTASELTEDANTGPDGNAEDLYEYDLERPVGERLKDLTVDHTDPNGAGVLGVAQVSEDGSYVYFVAEGNLGGDAESGQPNLYVVHDDAPPVFIATLSARDEADWFNNSFGRNPVIKEAGPQVNTAVVSPAGSRLAFLSEQSLTGYDNEQAEPGECEGLVAGSHVTEFPEDGKCEEAFYYNAESNKLLCASCNPTGASPVGPSSFTPLSGYPRASYRVRNFTEAGTLFFDSADQLVAHASDGRLNVYEYEDGHIYAISDVAGGFESFFLDASPDGSNVFFGTADQLLPQDVSNNVVVYDARADGGFPVSVAPPPCDNGDSCKPPPAPQPAVFGAPGSATFSGPGNLTPVLGVKPLVKPTTKAVKCKKGYTKKKRRCVKKAKAKNKSKKSSHRKGSK